MIPIKIEKIYFQNNIILKKRLYCLSGYCSSKYMNDQKTKCSIIIQQHNNGTI
jgi:hypothetical protein